MNSSNNNNTAAEIESLELQIQSIDNDMINIITANEKSKTRCENIIRNLNGIGGVAKMVFNCHQMAQDVQNFEAELAALNNDELSMREENVLLRTELENAVKCMETLLLDTEPAVMKKAIAAGDVVRQQQQQQQNNSGINSRKW